MKTSTTLFECDVCRRKRVDGGIYPAEWRESSFGFELLCDQCAVAIARFCDERRGLLTITIELPKYDPKRTGPISQPAQIAGIASAISGSVTTAGDSCGVPPRPWESS